MKKSSLILKSILASAIFLFIFNSHSKAQWVLTGSTEHTTNLVGIDSNVGIGMTPASTDAKLTVVINNETGNGIHLVNQTSWTRICAPSLTTGAFNSISRTGDAGVILGTSSGVNQNTYGYVIAPYRTGAASGLRVNQYGNVGIGTALTNNPNNYTLAVNGTIGAKAITVENTSSAWSDYVFESDYKLMPLSEVEKYVNKNKHLPEVPSAKEVEEKGINVADMDNILLRKIEELTLHMIRIEKENATLKSRLEKIENK